MSVIPQRNAVWRAPALLLLLACAGAWPLAASQIGVQPVDVCSGPGESGSCGDITRQLYPDYTNAIWAQADITVNFSAWDYHVAQDIAGGPTAAGQLSVSDQSAFDYYYGYTQYLSANPLTIWMWFVPRIDWCGSPTPQNSITFGCTYDDVVLISSAVFTYNRVDTIAHELGHSLGLPHCDPDCTGDYLMHSGTGRNIPTSLSQVGTYDRLSAAEVLTADSSPFATPEPATMGLFALGAAGIFVRKRVAKTPRAGHTRPLRANL